MGSESGNLALKVLAIAGLYLTGGIVTHLRAALRRSGFLQSFRRKGRFAELMSRIPVHVIVSKAGLTGAAAYGLQR
jgi:glucokinase